MTKLSIKNIKGETVKDITLDSKVWNIEVSDDALKKMIRLQLDSMRQGTRKTKTRAEVSGGGRKPWKQKGTGRARQGSIRATQWRGGGIAFGVNPRDYSFKINKKERSLALRTALTYKAKEKAVVVLDSIKLDNLKTKEFTKILETLKLNGKVLFVTKDESENLYMATRNLGNILVLMADELNCYDVVNADVIVLEEEAVKMVEEGLK
jgi:large subunit ribosomal protein L4